MKESKTIEFKEGINDSFLKTVSAFANYDGGKIYFGVNDKGEFVGLKSLDKCALQIENKINDSISPKPDFTIKKDLKNNILILKISSGKYKPYIYNNKIYKRNDTSTISVTPIEYNRMSLSGMNLNLEDLESINQHLTFDTLIDKFKKIKAIGNFDMDILKTLNLFVDNKYNNAALLLSEENTFPGIDFVRFGSDINEILDHETYEKCSTLTQFDKSIEICKKYYEYEKIENANRIKKEKLPIAAFREAISNALLHRVYDINARIKVEMYDDHIDIISPGGLPDGLSEEEYLSGKFSILRNPKLCYIFLQLNYIESLATGIRRIYSCYKDYAVHPNFTILENSITVSLPTYNQVIAMTKNENLIFNSIKSFEQLSSSEIAKRVGLSKPTCVRLLNQMNLKHLIKITGTGRGTTYQVIK